MEKKTGVKKRIAITVMAVLVLSALLAVLYRNYTKEICVIEPVEHMEQREGVSMNGILVEIEYSIIKEGEEIQNYLYVFENGDVYSGYNIDYRYVNDESQEQHQEQREREHYSYRMDDRYWDYLYEQCYWGRLSSRDLDGVINELAQVEVVQYRESIDDWPQPQTGTQMRTQTEIQTERTYDEENDNIYGGHRYRGRMESEGTEGLEWISRGSAEGVTMYRCDEHAHNAINIIKSTWAYGQWMSRLFGEGWEERIDLKDELKDNLFYAHLG